MAKPVTHVNEGQSGSGLTIAAAIRYAWLTWLGFLTVAFVLFIVVSWIIKDRAATGENPELAQRWFLIAMVYIAVAAPASIFWRSRVFRSYWQGRAVKPASYLAGMIAVWAALEVGILFALVGCLASHKLLPPLVPAIVGFVWFAPLWPKGLAMTKPVGDHEDTGTYEEPS